MNNKPFVSIVSIIIPTRNSSFHLETLLKSIKNQTYKEKEIIVVDNESSDNTIEIAKKYNSKIVLCRGKSPQVAKQRNLGAENAKGNYLFFMDHDMELSKDFLTYFINQASNKKNIDAWYIPEKIVANNKFLSIARNFEGSFVDGTVVSAARLIKRKSFFFTEGYDENLSGGPSDWDLDIQLKLGNTRFAILNKFMYHHEEKLTLINYISKKTKYIKGGIKYKKKWKETNKQVYKNIVVKQYSPYYRLVKIFIENGNWKRLLKQPDKYLVFLLVKILMSTNYLINSHRENYVG